MSRQLTDLVDVRENKEEILEICKLAKEFMTREYNIDIEKTEGIHTIAYCFFTAALDYLNEHKSKSRNIEINLLDIMTVGISYRAEEGEKDGNYTPFIKPGAEFLATVIGAYHDNVAVAKEQEKREKKEDNK